VGDQRLAPALVALVVAVVALAGLAAGCGSMSSSGPAASGHAGAGAGSGTRASTSSGSGSGSGSGSTLGGGVPAGLAAEARPIGLGRRFHPPATGPVIGPCRSPLGARFGVHVELFAANRVVLLPAGIGAVAPLQHSEGRISGAGCFGSLVTIEPTGVLLVRPGPRLTVADLFRSWGQPLSARRLAGFVAPGTTRVVAFVDGRARPGPSGTIPLTRHSEIVLEVGPHVPPHSAYRFPPGD
jgi:hypothetical protein